MIGLFEQGKHDYIEKLVLNGYFEQLPDMGERLGVVDMRERIINSLQKAEAIEVTTHIRHNKICFKIISKVCILHGQHFILG